MQPMVLILKYRASGPHHGHPGCTKMLIPNHLRKNTTFLNSRNINSPGHGTRILPTGKIKNQKENWLITLYYIPMQALGLWVTIIQYWENVHLTVFIWAEAG